MDEITEPLIEGEEEIETVQKTDEEIHNEERNKFEDEYFKDMADDDSFDAVVDIEW